MTVLTIITNSNDHTVYFEKPLEREDLNILG